MEGSTSRLHGCRVIPIAKHTILTKLKGGLPGVGEYTLPSCYASLKSHFVDYIPAKSPDEILTAIKDGSLQDNCLFHTK